MKALMAPLPDNVRKKLDAIGVKGDVGKSGDSAVNLRPAV